MPSKKKPISLEAASLQSIGRHIFLPSITKAVKNILIRYLFEYFGDKELKTEKQNLYRTVFEEHELNQSWWNEYRMVENVGNCKINKNKSTSFKTQSMQTIEDNVFQLQKFFFVETAHYFHSFIAIECLIVLSNLMKEIDKEEKSDTSSVMLHNFTESSDENSRNEIFCPESNSLLHFQLQRYKKDYLLEFTELLCHKAVKQIDISTKVLENRSNLHWSVVVKLCEKLVDMPQLQKLNLGNWNCSKYSLLANHNQMDGWAFKYLTKLQYIEMSNVSSNVLQSIGQYCLQLQELYIYSSSITDSVISWISNCKQLKLVELYDNKTVSPVGYAHLIRQNPELRSVGRCDNFGQVLSALYDEESIYRRSVGPKSIPQYLSLEKIESKGKISPKQLTYLTRHCPIIKSICLKYLPNDSDMKELVRSPSLQHVDEVDKALMHTLHDRFLSNEGDFSMVEDGNDNSANENQHAKINIDTCDIAPLDDDNFNHLAELCTLEALHDINLSSSDFFSHSLFQYLEVRGDQITTLILRDIDEMNLNAVILIGDRCSNLRIFALIQCHFQMEIGDTLAVERIVSERFKKTMNTIRPIQNQAITIRKENILNGSTSKRVRSTSSTCSDPEDELYLPPPFQNLLHLNIHLNSPTHMPIFQYILSFSQNISNLAFEQFFVDYDETLIISTLFKWNDLKSINELTIRNGSNLSLSALNEVIHKCPKLRKIGQISTWGKVTKHQLETIRKEIKLRNFDLVIDDD